MENLFLLDWRWFNEDGKPGAFMWAALTLAAVIVFAGIMFLIFRLYGRSVRKRKIAEENKDNVVDYTPAEPTPFEKREDNNQLEFYDPAKAREEAAQIEEQQRAEEEKRRQEEERLQALMLEEERKRKELEAKERAFDEKRQREEEARLERERQAEERLAEKERQAAERLAEKERIRAEKEAAKAAKKNRNRNENNFFVADEDDAAAFNFNEAENEQDDDALNFWNQAETNDRGKAPVMVETAPATDPRLEKVLEELENQKQAEQTRFANLMAELEQQKQETARLQGELSAKEKSEDLVAQAKKEMEQMIKDSQAKIDNIEKLENKDKDNKDLLSEIKNVLAAEREAQEQRLRDQENSLAAVLSAMENERRAKEENALNAEKEAKKEDEFMRMQNQYQDAIMQMQEKFQQMLEDANAQKQVTPTNAEEREIQNAYQAQLERERADTAALIDQMQREVDKMNAEREAERREYAEKQRALDTAMAEALQTQRNEFEQAQQRAAEANVANVEKILQDMEKQRADEMAEYKNEIAALRETIAAELEQKKHDDEDAGNQVVYAARDTEADEAMKNQIEAMQNEIQRLNALREAEREASEQRHAELLETLNRTIVTGENARTPETQQAERESVDRILNDLEHQNRLEQDRFADIMNELAESREDTKKAQEAMQQLIQESSELINQLNNKQEIRGIDEETMNALKDLLAHEREMQEKRLAEHEDKLNLAVSTIEEQKQNLVEEQNKQAEYEQMIANMREQYEAELASLRDTIANQAAVEEVANQTAVTAKKKVSDEDDDNGNEVEFTSNEIVNDEVLAQLAQLQENIAALEEARNAERAEFEQRYDELNKVLEDSMKVQRLEMELEKEREMNELKMQQALAEQRAEIEAAKEQADAENKEQQTQDVNEQTNAIIASFKEEMNRQYEEFLNALKEKKEEAENAQKEYEALVEQASEADQAAIKEQQFDVQEMMEQLREERQAARAEAQALREELEAQRIETEAKLMKQLSEVKEGLVSELSSELEIKEKFDAMEREIEAHNQEKLQQNEAEEARIKQEYEEFKQRIADEVVALEEKNAALQAELEKARAEKDNDDEAKQAEYEENEKRLREKYMQLRNELMKEAEQVTKQSEEIAAEKQAIEDKKKDLEEEKARLQNEVAMLKQQVLEIKTQDNDQNGTITEEQLAEVRASLEAEYQQREKEMLDKLEEEKQALVAREAQLKLKETNIEHEEERIREQSKAVTTMITNREYTKEERERLVLDYSLKLQDLEDRLRQNEKALRENNREFIPLRRIKNTLDRDLRLLRKREAIVAKQEVLVYGVNNISTVDPERIKKLEQDIKQLTGLQQSVANCETILNKNKDRYPTLENLDKVLRAQNEQIHRDLEEVKAAMAMFGEDATAGAVQE
ncbi:MAG: hypothetical protein NC133_01655 [Prevotella sp.]|nr:hypothetical protein [Prevotella sp.]